MTPAPTARHAKEFAGWVRDQLPHWPDYDVNEWLRACLPRFGTPGWDWSKQAAFDLAAQFREEASTW